MTENIGDRIGSCESTPSEPEWVRLDGRCQHEGCSNQGISYSYPHEEYGLPPKSEVYCARHARAAGFCIGCGQFWGGIESFDFGDSPLCEECLTLSEEEYEHFDDGDYEYDPYYS